MNRHLHKEAEEAEADRKEERKKSFWGKRRVKIPVSPRVAQLEEEVDTTANLTSNQSKPDSVKSSAKYKKAVGDDFADERDAGPLRNMTDDQPIHPHHLPHLHMHQQYDRPTWLKECWEDLRVGDFVRLRGDESVPAGWFIPLYLAVTLS